MGLTKFSYLENKCKKITMVKKVAPYSAGLMFRKKSYNLLFSLKRRQQLDITSIFCKPFIAIWLDQNKKVIKKIHVKKWKFRIPGEGMYLLEIPDHQIDSGTK